MAIQSSPIFIAKNKNNELNIKHKVRMKWRKEEMCNGKKMLNTSFNVAVMELDIGWLANVYTVCVRAFFRGYYVEVGNGCTIDVEYHYMSPWAVDKIQMIEFKVIATNETQCLPSWKTYINFKNLYIYIYIYIFDEIEYHRKCIS